MLCYVILFYMVSFIAPLTRIIISSTVGPSTFNSLF